MKMENLRNSQHKLINYMETAGYSKDYIGRVQKMIHEILVESTKKNWDNYKDVYRYYEVTTPSRKNLIRKQAIIGIIMRFDNDNKFPDGTRPVLVEKGAYYKLSPEYRLFIDYYRAMESERNKKESSIKTECLNVSAFLLTQQKSGANRLEDITEKSVMSVFVSQEGKQLKGSSYRKYISAFLKVCMPLNPTACRKVLSFIPLTKTSRRNIQYLTPQEAQAVLIAMDDKANSLTLRDRAIGKLAYYTGLRSGDIARLEVTSIDWECDRIQLKQQKTGEPMEFLLTATIGNAIYEYLYNERPSADCPALFPTHLPPYRVMNSANVWRVASRIMKEAGIRQSRGDRKGFHVFRHHLATALLGNDIPQPIISDALGHVAPDSLETYLSADFIHLKECALSVARFPMYGEVFDVE